MATDAYGVLELVARSEPIAATVGVVAVVILGYLTFTSRASTKAMQRMSEMYLGHITAVGQSNKDLCVKLDLLSLDLRAAVGKTWLSKDQATRVVSDAMWREADKQLQYLEAILLNNHIDRPERKRFLEANIKSKFLEFSESVKDNLNEFNAGLGQLGDFVYDGSAFDRTRFHHDLFEIFFRPQAADGQDKEIDIQVKMKDLSGLLRSAHYEVTESIRAEYKPTIPRR